MTQEFKNRFPNDWRRNRKIKIVRSEHTQWKLVSYTRYCWSANVPKSGMWYVEDLKSWTGSDFFDFPAGGSISSKMFAKSIKGLIRKLRKSYLPAGIEFRLRGSYVGQDYIIRIK